MHPSTDLSGFDFQSNQNGLNNAKGNKNIICTTGHLYITAE